MNKLKHTFFCSDVDNLLLSEKESKHALKVLRMKVGDRFILINGQGAKCICTINETSGRKVGFTVNEKTTTKRRKEGLVHIAIAPTKSFDRFGFFVEKAVELGIDRISPIITQNSERSSLNMEKIEKKVIVSLKQSGGTHLPELDDTMNLDRFLTLQDLCNDRFIAHCGEETAKNKLDVLIKNAKNAVILIGPEGDFRPEEIILAKENNFVPVSLGDLTLRTETAGLIACHIARLTFG